MTELIRVRAASAGWDGAPGLNTFYFVRNPLTNSAQEAADLCVARVTAAFNDAKGIYPLAWSVTIRAEVDFLTAETGQLVDTLTAPGDGVVTGTGGSGFGPLAVALLVRLRTNTFNDGSRVAGRAFLGPMGGFNTPAGGPNAGMIAGGVAFKTALFDVGIGNGPRLNVWRRPRPANPARLDLPARAGMVGEVISMTVSPKWAVLTSRRD